MTNPKTIAALVDWQSELTRIATKHNVIVCWVAIIISPLWFIADYFTIPSHWKIFFAVRLSVAFIILLAVLLRKKINMSTEVLIFIPVFGLSLQNAYMWSVMDVSMLQKHAFAYIALFIGAGMLVLWKPIWSIAVVILSFIANIIFLRALSALTTQEILLNGGMLVATVAVMSIVLIHTRYVLTKKEIIGRLTLAETNKELAQKNHIIEEKNKEITDSITYAKRLQEAILPPMDYVNKHLPDNFILYKPKDIVAGDFYWMEVLPNVEDVGGASIIFIAAADCTGHGVPGAMVSVICSNALNRAVKEFGLRDTGKILDKVSELVLETFEKSDEDVKDGMDISLMAINKTTKQINWSGANNPFLYILNPAKGGTGSVIEITADKQPIGKHDNRKPFTTHTIQLQTGNSKPETVFYLFTDGYADQFGGPKRKKFMYRNFVDLLLSIQEKTMDEQKKILESKIENWKGDLEQIDDILVIGLRH